MEGAAMTAGEIRAIRAAAGMTQAEFAAALGSDLRTVQRWEAGDRKPRGAAVKLLEQIGARAKRKKKGQP
jgi:putative transcriptional regulator